MIEFRQQVWTGWCQLSTDKIAKSFDLGGIDEDTLYTFDLTVDVEQHIAVYF